jgi:hypothetical protein
MIRKNNKTFPAASLNPIMKIPPPILGTKKTGLLDTKAFRGGVNKLYLFFKSFCLP